MLGKIFRAVLNIAQYNNPEFKTDVMIFCERISRPAYYQNEKSPTNIFFFEISKTFSDHCLFNQEIAKSSYFRK